MQVQSSEGHLTMPQSFGVWSEWQCRKCMAFNYTRFAGKHDKQYQEIIREKSNLQSKVLVASLKAKQSKKPDEISNAVAFIKNCQKRLERLDNKQRERLEYLKVHCHKCDASRWWVYGRVEGSSMV
jgi:uncharacterized protein YlxW (UPF0749 family)